MHLHGSSPRQIFDAEMQSFFLLFNRFLTEKAKGEKM
jgi:UTP--glucose-1-phosphate uridylyltransferase